MSCSCFLPLLLFLLLPQWQIVTLGKSEVIRWVGCCEALVCALSHGCQFLHLVWEHRVSCCKLVDLRNRQPEDIVVLRKMTTRCQLFAKRKREASTTTIEKRLFEASPLAVGNGGVRPAENFA